MRNPLADIAAPGTAIYSTVFGNLYDYMSGTSMAAPHVSGVAALIKSYYPNLSVAQIKQRIISSNNVSYNSSLMGKVSSNGSLNAWNSFCNDSLIPRKSQTGDSEYNNEQIKDNIIAHMNNALPEELTAKLYINFNDNYNSGNITSILGLGANIIKENNLTGSLLVEYPSITDMENAVILLNSLDDVNYAEPVYRVFCNTTK